MATASEILNDPAYTNANEATKQAIFDKHIASDPSFVDANSATQAAIRQRFGLAQPSPTPLQTVDVLGHQFTPQQYQELAGKIGIVPSTEKVNAPAGEKEATVLSQLIGGTKQIGSDYSTLVKSLGSQERANKAALEELQNQQRIQEEVGKTRGIQEVKEAYAKEGFPGASKEVASQVPGAIAASTPQMVTTIGGNIVGGVLTESPLGAYVGGFATLYPQFYMQNLAEQADQQLQKGEPVNVNRARAAGAAVVQAGIEEAGTIYQLGKNFIKSFVKTIPKNELEKKLVTKTLVEQATQKLGTVGKAVGRTAFEESIVNPSQTLLSRWQSGQDILSDEAIKQYGEDIYGSLLQAPLGIATGAHEVHRARKTLAEAGIDWEGNPIQGPQPQTEGQKALSNVLATASGQQNLPKEPEVVKPEVLLDHAKTRLQELEIKANGRPAQETVDENGQPLTIPAQPAQPMTEKEVAELKFLQEHQNNPDKLAEGYGVTIGKPTVTGSQDIKAALGELEGQEMPIPPIYQPPVETKPVETKPVEPEKPAEPEAEPEKPETPPEEETPPTVIKEPPKLQAVGKVLDSVGKEHELTTVGEAVKAGFSFDPINSDKPMYAKTDLDGVNAMVRNLFEDKGGTSYTNMTASSYKVTPDQSKVIPTTQKKNQVSVEFRPDTLSGRQTSQNEFQAYDTAHKAIESFTVHNPSNRFYLSPLVKRFFDRGFNEDGSVTYTLKRVKSAEELAAEKEELSKKYLAHINAPRGKLRYNYQRLRTPGLNSFQQAMEKYTKLGDALRGILPELEKIAKSGWDEGREASSMPFTMELKNKEQVEMYVDIIKHLLKVEPAMKTSIFMDPHIIGSSKRTIPGFYNRVTNNLAMFANGYLDTFIHEAIHAATVHYIEMHPNDPKVQKLEKILEASRKHDRKTRKGEDMLYGNTNLKEFIAEVFSSPEFIQHLSSMDPIFDKAHSTSIFDNVKSIIRNMLKAMGVNVEKNKTALDEVMDLSSELFTGKTLEGYLYDKKRPVTEDTNIITESMRPDYESVEPESGSRVQTKPGANTAILADILGQQMYSTDIGRVSVKEMLQNSFDAIKSMLDSEKIKHGKIDINTNETNRIISVKDNGHGMTQDTLGNTFVTIAGSLKESEISSGSFGVAKLAFLFDAENIHVATMRDGKISVLNTNGKQLKDSLSDPSLAPYTDSYTPEEYGLDKVKKDFPDGHGTITTIQIPETYVNKNGEKESISFPKYVNNHYSLTWSPLRDNIDVTFNGNKVDDVGSDFKKNDYETIANIKYPWGHVHVFASKEKQDHIDTSSNVTVLSDGLYQFLDKIPVNWGETGIEAKSIKRNIYFDVVPSIRANEPGYPFSLDREGFTSKAKKDLEKIKQFIWSKYRLMELKDTSSEFGDFHYVIKKGNKITTKQPNKLTTNKKEDTSNPLNVSANLESKNGKLAPNTNKVPTIDAKTLDDIDIDIDQFKVNQDQIDPNATLIHNNLLVRQNEYTLLSNERDRLQEKMDKDQAMLDQMPKYFPDTFDETPEHKALRESIDKQYEEIEKLSNKMWDTPASSTWKPIDVLGREKFGERFDRCMYDIGDIFRAIRDRVVILAHKGDLPNGESYAPLQKYAVGISFDQEYLGVNVKLPFNGVYVNPIFSDFKDNYRTKAMGLFGTMIHELAHFQVSGHGAQFPKEMQRITAALEADENFDINDLRQELIAIYKKNDDILTYLNTLGENKNDTKPVGIRFQDEQYERRTTSTIGDLAQTGAEGKARQIISRDVEQRDRDAQQMRQPQPVSPEAQTDEEIIYQEEQATRQIFNYRGNPVSINEWEIPEQGRIAATLSKWFQYFADEDAVLTRIMKTLRSLNRYISDMTDIEKKQELKNSRISAQLMVFANEEVNPIVKEMLAKGVSLEEINKYLLAKHSPAYNDRMNNINHKVDRNGNIVPYALKDRASSMHTQDALDYLNNLTTERKQTLENIAKKWYAIRDKTQKILVESGQETQETIDLWNETYPFYVPLNREQEQQAVPNGLRTGAGVDVRGDFSKRAMGSEKQVISIADALLYQRERAVARAENSKVGESIYRLFLEHPNPNFAISVNPDAIHDRDALIQELENMGYTNAADIADNIMAEPKERYLRKVKPSDFVIDPTTGFPIPNTPEVVDARISRNARFGDNVLTFKINGRERYVFFSKKDPNATVMVHTLKNLNAQELGAFLRANRFITHYLGQVYTVLNPIFGIVNGFKDYPFGMINLSTTPIRGKQLQVSAKIMPAMIGIMSVLRKERAGGGYSPMLYKWQRIYNEALDAGFQTSNRYAILHTGEDRTYIANLLDQFKDNNAKQVFRYVINMTYDFSSMIENGVRLAAYQQMREAGHSPQESASVAKNLTINFDKKGSRTAVLRTLYLFFNASIQGTVRLGKTLAGPSGGRIITGGVLLGVMQAMMMAAAGFKDDDPPEYIREHNLIIPTGDGKYNTIPMPYGLNILPNTGRILTEAAIDITKHKGLKDAHVGKHALNWTNAFFSAFSPFGNQGLSMNALVPTAWEAPFAISEHGTNTNAFGQTISRKDSYTRPTPGFARTKESGTEWGKEFARWMNRFTLGTDAFSINADSMKGAWSPTGDDIDFLASTYLGPVLGSINKTYKYIKAKTTGEEVPAYQVPVLGRFQGETNTKPVITSRFYNNLNAMYEHEYSIKNLRDDPKAREQYMKDHPDARGWRMAEGYEAQINNITAKKKQAQLNHAPQEVIQRLDNIKIIKMNQFNDAIERLRNQ